MNLVNFLNKKIAEVDVKLKGCQMSKIRYGLQQKKKAYEEVMNFLDSAFHKEMNSLKTYPVNVKEAIEFQEKHGE